MAREIEAIETIYKGKSFRSRTEARWAVFFDVLELNVKYEEEKITLDDGRYYLPDFYIEEFNCYFEVKGNHNDIVIEEASKALTLSRMGKNVLLAKGAPSPESPNIIYFNKVDEHHNFLKRDKDFLSIEEILQEPTYLGRLMEDRRDKEIYWYSTEQPDCGGFSCICVLGGKGTATDHEKFPLIHWKVEMAYQAAQMHKFE